MPEENNKSIATEINFKIRRIANLFHEANQCREEGDNVGWSSKLAGILIEISSKIPRIKLTECDNSLRIIKRRISNNLNAVELLQHGYRITDSPTPKGGSVYDMLIKLTYDLQILTEECGFGSPLTNKKPRKEY